MAVHVRVEGGHWAGLLDGEPVPGGGLDGDDPPGSDVHQVVAVPDRHARRAHPVHRVVQVSRLQQVPRHEVQGDGPRGDLADRRRHRVEREGLNNRGKWKKISKDRDSPVDVRRADLRGRTR